MAFFESIDNLFAGRVFVNSKMRVHVSYSQLHHNRLLCIERMQKSHDCPKDVDIASIIVHPYSRFCSSLGYHHTCNAFVLPAKRHLRSPRQPHGPDSCNSQPNRRRRYPPSFYCSCRLRCRHYRHENQPGLTGTNAICSGQFNMQMRMLGQEIQRQQINCQSYIIALIKLQGMA